MNLLEDAWIPVKRRSGTIENIAPWQLVETDDPVLAVHAARPDFNGALLQFLIGLMQTAVTPDNYDKWVDWLEEPPTPELLRENFKPFSEAFNLDGDGPRFMQDYDELDETGCNGINALLIDSPGDNAIKKNTDHFIKQGRAAILCSACAATALFTLQTNAPAGGQGHRVSLRGGGPLTTLVVLDPEGSGLESSLWQNIWLNVLEQKKLTTMTGDVARKNLSDIFPWLAPTRTSEKITGKSTTPLDAHPLQMFWGMPRRIRIDWDTVTCGCCEICGCRSDKLLRHYITKNLGIEYTGSWQHPLSPHYLNNKGEVLPMHAQPGGLTYRHWLGMTTEYESIKPALVARRFAKLAKEYGEQFRLHIFGYDMDNMKARCWYETTFPLYLIPEQLRNNFTIRVQALTESAEKTAKAVRTAVKESWFKRPGDAKGDTSFLTQAFYQHTEPYFYQAVQQLIHKLPEKTDIEILQEWHSILRQSGLQLFDYWAEQGDISENDPRRIAMAREKLFRTFNNKNIRELLHVPMKKRRNT